VVTRLIESAQTQPLDVDFDLDGDLDRDRDRDRDREPPPKREITRTVKIVMRQARSLPVAVALVLIAAAFIIGVVLGDRRETSPVAPVVVPSPALAGAVSVDAPAAATTANTGFDLRVKPAGAEVVLDGKPIGRAPLRVRNLTAGSHTIELAADGYFARRQVVALEADAPKTLSIAMDRLEPEPVAEARSTPEPVRASPPPPEDPEDPAPPPEPREQGTLKIGAKPPCEVRINGVKVGMTPHIGKVAAGRHRVSLVNPTYSINERIGVKVKSGETVKILRDYSDMLEAAGSGD
jgi:serine/threonine-protein kinase